MIMNKRHTAILTGPETMTTMPHLCTHSAALAVATINDALQKIT
jgi:hypothetical protein